MAAGRVTASDLVPVPAPKDQELTVRPKLHGGDRFGRAFAIFVDPINGKV